MYERKKKINHINLPIPLNFSYPIVPVPTSTERKKINQNDGIYNIERYPELYRNSISSARQISYPNQFSDENMVIGQVPTEIIQSEVQGNSYLPISYIYVNENTANFQEENFDKTKQMENCEGEKIN